MGTFRQFVTQQILVESDVEAKLNSMLEEFVFYFKKDGEIFGAGEDSRIVFAKMKQPDQETPKGWAAEASFSAINLHKSIQGESSQRIFDQDDLKSIKIIDQDRAFTELKKEVDKLGDKAFASSPQVRLHFFKAGEPSNFVRADEE